MGMAVGAGHVTATPVRARPLGDLETQGPRQWRSHGVQFYEDDAFLLQELSRYIGSALVAGDAGVVIATAAHRDGLARRLTKRGLDLSMAAAQGRFVSLDAAETLSTFMRRGRLDPERFAEHIGGLIARVTAMASGAPARIAVFGEMVALLWAEGQAEAAIQLEYLWNDLARAHVFQLQCAYPLGLFPRASDGEMVEKICAAHEQVIPAESYTSLSEDGARLRTITLLQQKAQALEAEVAELRRAQQALGERNRELGKAVAARDDFLSVAAHELKTPITGLRGFAQLLLRDMRRRGWIAPERLAAGLAAIDSQTEKLIHLVARLFDVAQLEAGNLRIEPVGTDLVGLVRATLAQQPCDDRHSFAFDGPARLDAMVDPLRFEQVLTNLLVNAVTFSPGGGRVTVRLEQEDDGSIHLSVTDHGLGVPVEQREAVFGRFHQAHGLHHLSGLGLGLYLTRAIVELHEGCVRIEQPEHPGSRFVVTLPPAATPGRQER